MAFARPYSGGLYDHGGYVVHFNSPRGLEYRIRSLVFDVKRIYLVVTDFVLL
jgi:hypothetical protein